MFEVYMIPAEEGDAYHVAYGPDEKCMHHLIIDGGPASCGRKVADIMEEIIDAKEHMDIILTHIDEDHIVGLLKALRIVRKEYGTKKLASAVEHFYYNTCQEYQRRKALPITGDDLLIDAGSGDISVAQGINLRKFLEESRLLDKLVYNMQGDLQVLHGAELFFISPSEEMMEKLNKDENKYLLSQEKKKGNGDCAAEEEPEPFPYESLSAFSGSRLQAEESRPANLSSLAFLIRYQDVCAAFLGDARADVCLSGLKVIRDKYKAENGESLFPDPCPVDFMKVAHHGSAHSNLKELFEALPTDYYLISTNGGKGKSYGKMPSKQVLSKMVENHPNHKITVFVNDNWWEKGQMRNYFTEEDKTAYLDPADPKITLRNTAASHFQEKIKEGLIIYGSQK